MSIGTCFQVTADEEMTVLIGAGRAWFDHTWTLNDAPMPLVLPQSEILLNRIDAIVLEVNESLPVRANSIKVIKGTPSANPVRPTLTKTATIHQYPLAYVSVKERVTSIRQADITNMVGTSETPFVTGILETVNIDMLVAQWEDQWTEFYENQTTDMTITNNRWKQQWNEWYSTYTKEMADTGRYWKDRWESWFYMYVNTNSADMDAWKRTHEEAFVLWFQNIQNMLNEEQITAMASEIMENRKRISELERFQQGVVVYESVFFPLYGDGPEIESDILDSDDGVVLDANGESIFSVEPGPEEPLITSDGTPLEVRKKLCFL